MSKPDNVARLADLEARFAALPEKDRDLTLYLLGALKAQVENRCGLWKEAGTAHALELLDIGIQCAESSAAFRNKLVSVGGAS